MRTKHIYLKDEVYSIIRRRKRVFIFNYVQYLTLITFKYVPSKAIDMNKTFSLLYRPNYLYKMEQNVRENF